MSELVDLDDAKAQLPCLIDRAIAGEDIVIGRAGQPLVRLLLVDALLPREPGLMRGLTVPDAFFDPLPEDAESLWE
jgi:antitoxin (DNA-binding transcriptional repressor) of toxin-antitoxin stability system